MGSPSEFDTGSIKSIFIEPRWCRVLPACKMSGRVLHLSLYERNEVLKTQKYNIHLAGAAGLYVSMKRRRSLSAASLDGNEARRVSRSGGGESPARMLGRYVFPV